MVDVGEGGWMGVVVDLLVCCVCWKLLCTAAVGMMIEMDPMRETDCFYISCALLLDRFHASIGTIIITGTCSSANENSYNKARHLWILPVVLTVPNLE